jgi:hypothetical protein
MISMRSFAVLCAALSLSACVSATAPASRAAMPAGGDLAAANSQSSGQIDSLVESRALTLTSREQGVPFDVETIRINVSRSLSVSEANTFKPRADIVWRGEARGDRHAQVTAIFQEAMTQGTALVQVGRKADLEVDVTRFHALTEKTRYTFGGMHEMRFVLTLRDSATGQVLDGPREVVADIKASGGSAAIAEEQAGRTQRVVTVERLAQVIRQELSAPQRNEMIISRLQTAPAPLAD